MYVLCLFIVTLAPIFFLGLYIYHKDIYEKEPKKMLVKLFFSGVLSVIITVILTSVLQSLIPFFKAEDIEVLNYSLIELFIYVFIGVALIEELSKWIYVKVIAWKNKEFNYVYDAIVYAVFVALGFATIENVMYSLIYSTAHNVLLRAILSVPCHAFCGVFMGYFLGKAKLSKILGNQQYKIQLFLSLSIPIIIHGVFDYLIYAYNLFNSFLIIFIIFIVFLYIISFICIKRTSKDATTFINNEN